MSRLNLRYKGLPRLLPGCVEGFQAQNGMAQVLKEVSLNRWASNSCLVTFWPKLR